VATFGKVQPRDEVCTRDRLYVGADQSMVATPQSKLFADNISDPIEINVTVTIEADEQPVPEDRLDGPLADDE
jgi:hypothetical protein